jgi:trimeric autotransporter adhesin
MKRSRVVPLWSCLSLLLVALFCFVPTSVLSEEWRAVWGDLHAHSSLSDGKGMPGHAFQYASRHCNFFALTEHNHQLDENELNTLIGESDQPYGKFVPVFGQEFSTLKAGNHLNVFNLKECIPGAMNGNFRRLYSKWLPDYQARHPSDIIICQFNHPENRLKDYGISRTKGVTNYQDDWEAFVEDANRWVRLIAVLNGPGSHEEGQHNRHGDIKKDVETWFFYLDKGLHLSPTCNHDTHVESWGDLTTARTGVWLNMSLTRENLLKALKAGRCFATEDKNLSVWFTINDHPMGSQLADMGTADLKVTIQIKDEDEPASNYDVEVYRDVVGDDELAESVWKGHARCGQEVVTTLRHQKGMHESYLVHVAQTDESDNVDDAWTAPIFIGPGTTEKDEESAEEGKDKEDQAVRDFKFVGSKNSKLYHHPSCRSVKTIKAENLVKYPSAPEGKTLHAGCPAE